MKASERVVAAAVFVLIGIAPFMVSRVLDRFESTTDPDVRTIISALQSGHAPETVTRLEAIVKRHPENGDLRLLLGSAYVRADRLGEGFDAFEAILSANPAQPQALVDLGNVYFRLGEFAEAGVRYRKATEVQPALTAAWWNLYLAQTELLHFAEAEASLARARALDSDRVGALAARKQGENAVVLLLDEVPAFQQLRESLLKASTPVSGGAAHLVTPLSIASFVGLCFSLLLCIGGTAGAAASCSKCGSPHCALCTPAAGGAPMCRGCTHLFVKKSGMAESVRAAGIADLARRGRLAGWVTRLASIGLPGSGMIFAGRSVLGFAIMMCWIVAGALFLGRDALLTAPKVPVTDFPGIGAIALALTMALAWLAGNILPAARREDPEVSHGA